MKKYNYKQIIKLVVCHELETIKISLIPAFTNVSIK
jgi:hypothetical protein